MIKVYYRFSFRNMPNHDGTPRPSPNRPDWFDKWRCLENFATVFSDHDITVIADGVEDDVWAKLKTLYPSFDLQRTNFGSNAGSFLYSLDQAIKLPATTCVYFVEDDYLHHEGADIILEQGLSKSPYVSLYDHPDKYWNENADKLCKVFMTEDCHWRTTGSTTMTFASRAGFLNDDKDIFQRWCGGEDRWTHDFQLFTELSQLRGLITPIPGYATHLDTWVIAKMVDWKDLLDRTSNNI
jgi:hypothetical protein